MRLAKSCLHVALFSALPIALAACAGLPCQPASYFSPPAEAPFRAEEVRVPTAKTFDLVGTLTLPEARKSSYPAVLLITGSSPQNRDMMGGSSEPLTRYRPFRQMADAFTRRGIAVLRLDDRGVGCSGGGPLSDATTADRAEDSRAALQFLRGRPDIDRRRLGLIGISEGANIAIMIAATDHALSGVVSMAGSAGPGWEVWRYQTRYKISLGEDMSDAQRERWEKGEDPERILEERFAEANDHVRFGKADPWWTFFVVHDPLPAARKVASPILILHGDRDSNVPVAHAHTLAEAIRSGGNPDVIVKIFADHNHLFLPDSDGGFRRYMSLLAHTNQVPDHILALIADWLSARLQIEE